jgi:hypothetical protein
MSCPKCRSDDWKMASVIHAEGLSGISTSTIGIGASADIFGGVGVADTNGTKQTLLSELAAPPQKKISGGFLMGIGLLPLIFGLFLESQAKYDASKNVFISGLVLILLGLTTNILNQKELNKKYDLQLIEYQKKKMCLRCGTFFFDDCEISSPSVVAPPTIKESLNSSDMKKCPFCAEEVKADAIRCKHCRSDI